MGQYYRGVILGKTYKKSKKIIVRESFCCYAHDNGAKLMEHSYVGNWYVKEYENALANKFYGYPFVWVGDYANERLGENVYTKALEFIDGVTEQNAKSKGYIKIENGRWGEDFAKSDGTKVSYKHLANKTEYQSLTDYKYVINLTKRLYVKIEKSEETNIHPLPLLCSDGNGRGGGDYEGTNMDLIGSWAYNRIGVSNEVPEGFRELVVRFVESYDGGDSSVNDYKIVKHNKGE